MMRGQRRGADSRTLQERMAAIRQTFWDAGMGVIVSVCHTEPRGTVFDIDLAPDVRQQHAFDLRPKLAAALGVGHVRIVFGVPSGRWGILVPNRPARA